MVRIDRKNVGEKLRERSKREYGSGRELRLTERGRESTLQHVDIIWFVDMWFNMQCSLYKSAAFVRMTDPISRTSISLFGAKAIKAP